MKSLLAVQTLIVLVCAVATCADPTDPVFLDPEQDADANLYLPEAGTLVMVEQTTGSQFNLRGEAISGPLSAGDGLVLKQVVGINMFWFAWSVFYPGSEIWGRPETVRQGELPAAKTGSAACGGGIDCIPSLPNAGVPAGALNWAKSGDSGANYLSDDDLVVGTFYQRFARAYPHNILWWHEIANDRIGAMSYTVTFCPLTGSAVVWSGGEAEISFGVSGNLFNSNLVMYDHQSDSLWPQLWMQAVSGPSVGRVLDMLPFTETTWGQWKKMHPQTLVLSSDTGSRRNYQSYPYGSYRSNNSDTFRATTPAPDPIYATKDMTFGIVGHNGGTSRAYVHQDLEIKAGSRSVTSDTLNGVPLLVVYDRDAKLVLAFEARNSQGELLEFVAGSYTP